MRTERLVLRAAGEQDMPLLVRLLGDEPVRRYLGGPRPEAVREAIAAEAVGRDGDFVVVTDTGEGIGRVGISDEGHGGPEVSYVFLEEAWGHGYAGEAVAAVVAWAYETGGAVELLAVTQAANAASRRLLARLGATEVSRFVEFDEEQVMYRVPHRAA